MTRLRDGNITQMSILSDFEDRVASAVEGLFAGAFRSPVQPAEIAKALARAMDDRTAVGVGKVYAPHAYTVALSADDDDKLGSFRPTLAGELATFLTGHATERGYTLAARPAIAFTVHRDLRLGRFRVAASEEELPDEVHAGERAEAPATPRTVPVAGPAGADAPQGPPGPVSPLGLATVTVSAVEHDVALRGERVCVGRLSTCDIKLADANVSREHAAFVREGAGWAIEDLDSTNGTYLNGERVTHARLRDGDVISVGASELTYHEPRG